MSRTDRLTSAADFRRTYAEGRRASTRTVVAHVLSTGEDRPPRVGITAARGLKGSVERNRVKRRLREAVRRVDVRFPKGVDAVLVGGSAAGKAGFQDVVDNVRQVLSRAGAET